jgi:hypothetical protein
MEVGASACQSQGVAMLLEPPSEEVARLPLAQRKGRPQGVAALCRYGFDLLEKAEPNEFAVNRNTALACIALNALSFAFVGQD